MNISHFRFILFKLKILGEIVTTLKAVFRLTLWLVGECPNYHKTIAPKPLKRHLCALNFVPIHY